nr:NOP5/NOP56 family protein [uncultured Methanoregula sp.]
MRSYWFGDLEDGVCTPFLGDVPLRADRVAALRTNLEDFVPLAWEDARECGICTSREDYLSALREVCFFAAEQEIRDRYAVKDAELLQMVRTLDEIDDVINLLSERVAEWHQVRHPTFSRKYRKTPAHVLIKTIAMKGRGALGRTAGQIEQLAGARTDLAREVSDRANRVMPNTSALIGGLVAARLMAQAGGLLPLSRLPASVIQVLGARTALFAHLRTKSPSPKHGIIFQHRRVHNAPREVRGKVARVLAGKLAIAARLDYFRGVAVPEFLEKAQERIDAVGTITPGKEQP